MKDYTAIGTIFWNQRPSFRPFLGGMCQSLRSSKHSIGWLLARDVTNEKLHSDRNGLQPNHSEVLPWAAEGGVSRAIKASVNDVCAVYAREITKDEIHIRIQQEQPCGGADCQAPPQQNLQHYNEPIPWFKDGNLCFPSD